MFHPSSQAPGPGPGPVPPGPRPRAWEEGWKIEIYGSKTREKIVQKIKEKLPFGAFYIENTVVTSGCQDDGFGWRATASGRSHATPKPSGRLR